MPTVNTRPMEQKDIGPCARLMAVTPLWQRYGVSVESATARFAEAIAEGATILVADDGSGAALGFVWVVIRGAFDRSSYIPLIGVDPAQRGQGIGKILLAAAEAYARPNAADMFLLSSDFNIEAHRFYEREGYSQVGSIPDYVLPGVAEIIFRKRLE